MYKRIIIGISFVYLAICFSSCSSTGSYTSNKKFDEAILGSIEEKEIAYQGVYRNPIIMIHGFLGSKLIDKKTNQNIWGTFKGMDAISISPEKMRALAIPMQMGKPLNELKDDTAPNGILDTVTVEFAGITFKENAYINLVNILQGGGFQPEGFPLGDGKKYNTLFKFSYDWRHDLQYNATMLHKYVLEKRKYMQKQYEIEYGIKDYDVQFDLIGHSMGGLLSRYYLRYGTADLPPENTEPNITWAGSKYIDRLIILGTPNAGYLDTILEMQKGTKIPPFPPALLGTWPTYYQMLPVPSRRSVVYKNKRGRAVDLFDVRKWVDMRWGLADPRQCEILKLLLPHVKKDVDRRKIAIDHLRKCLKRAKRFIEVMQIEAKPPDDIQLYLVLGNAVKTTRKAVVDSRTGELEVVEYAPGDGKVTESSALFDERAVQTWKPYFTSPIHWKSIIQLRAAHMGITTDPAFKDNILFLLNAIPTKRQLENMHKLSEE